MVVSPTPHGLVDEFGKHPDIHDVDEPEALFLECTCPSAKICLSLQVLEGVHHFCHSFAGAGGGLRC